jgi:FMN reductase
MTRRVVVVSGGLGVPSTTRLLGDQLAAAAVRSLAARGETAQVEVVELRPLAHALADNLLTGFPSGDLAAALESVRRADALVVVTPVFAASYSGLFKMFFDVMEQGAVAGTPVVLAATAGTARHSLVLEHALRPLFAHLKAIAVPTAVFAASEDFGDTADGRLAERVDRAAAELADVVAGRLPVATSADGFEDPVPFEQLLKGT